MAECTRLLKASCFESYDFYPRMTITEIREGDDVKEFLRKVLEYRTFFSSTNNKENIEIKREEFKLLILTTDEFVIEKAFRYIYDACLFNYDTKIIKLFILHVLYTSQNTKHNILFSQLGKVNRLHTIFYLCRGAVDKYVEIFYQGLTLPELIHTIHHVWKSCPEIEFSLQTTYCGRLLQKKENKKFKYLVSTEIEYFASCLNEVFNSTKSDPVLYPGFFASSIDEVLKSRKCDPPLYPAEWIMHAEDFIAILYILHCSISFNLTPTMVNIGDVMSNIQWNCASTGFYERFYKYLILLDKDQLPSTKYFIHQLLHIKRINECFIIGLIIQSSVQLMENNYHDKSKHFLRHNLEHLQHSTCTSVVINSLDCKTRQGYCQILLELLNESNLSQDTISTELVTNSLFNLKDCLFVNRYLAKHKCYCYMGSKKCGLDSGMDDSRYTKLLLRLKSLQIYRYLYRTMNHEQFIEILKKLNGKLNKCRNKRQQIDIEISALNELNDSDSDWFILSLLYEEKMYYDNDVYDDVDDDDRLSAILANVADDCKDDYELKSFVFTLCQIELNHEVEDLYIKAITNSVYIKFNNQHTKIAQFVLDINKWIKKSSLLTKITLTLGEYLNFDKQVTKDKKKVLYTCFCKLRHAVSNGDQKDINIDEYRRHFTFIGLMERENNTEKVDTFSEFLIIVMLLLMSTAHGGHHKSAEMKKYLSLKYEYDKAILYLLWCSGDVEINPGPTLKKLKSVPASQKLRAWIWDMCSILLKTLKKISVDSKPKDVWKDKPANWPCHQPFYDPRNKSKGGNEDVKSDDSLLKCILDLCSQQQLDISQYEREITAWRAGDKKLLFELHTCRKEVQTINTAIQYIINVKDTAELQQMLGRKKMQITLPTQNLNKDNLLTQNVKNHKQKGTTDIIREVAVLLCKISKGIPPMEKSDGIWKSPPMRWKAGIPFYSPHNAGARSEKDQDKNLVNNLVEYIETENIDIPPEYTALVTAWKQQNMQELCQIYTVHTNVAVIENALKYLQLEGLLDKPDILGKLKQHGLTLSTEWFNRCSTSTGICDSNQASTGHQSSVNHSNEQQNSNGQNGSKCVSTCKSGSAPSCRKRSNTTGTQQAKRKCQNKRKLPQDENIATKKKREKLLVDNGTLNKTLLTNQNQVVSLEEDKAVHDNMGQSSGTSDKVFHVMSYESIPANGMKDIQDIDFWFASKIGDQDIGSDIHSPPRQLESKCKSSLKTIDKEIADIRKELNVEPPQMDAVSQTLNISTDQLSDMIDQYGLLSNNSLDVKQLENDKNTNSGSTENDLDIDLFELDKCEIDDEDKWSKNCEQQK